MMTLARHCRWLSPSKGSSSFSLFPLLASFLPVATLAPRNFGEGSLAAFWALPTFKKKRGGWGTIHRGGLLGGRLKGCLSPTRLGMGRVRYAKEIILLSFFASSPNTCMPIISLFLFYFIFLKNM